MYTVLHSFTDTVDGGTYWRGQKYPGKGGKPTQERIDYLLGDKNKFGKPVIGGAGATAAPMATKATEKQKR